MAKEICLTLEQARKIYEDHFKKELPSNLPYQKAASQVAKDIGWDEFTKLAAKY